MVMELAPQPAPISPKHTSVEEYLVRERRAEYRSDYIYGEIRAMSGGSLRHARIIAGLHAAVDARLRGKQCDTILGDLQLQVDPDGLYVYPDLTVICGKPRLLDQNQDVLLNPTVIFEVLSPSTENYDLGLKSTRYRKIESLKDLLLISQSEPMVEHYSRQSDEVWLLTTIRGPSGHVRIESIDCTLPLVEIYERVEFGT